MFEFFKNIFRSFRNCSCAKGEFEYLSCSHGNKIYKCLKCNGREPILKYRGGVMSVNPKMMDFYYKTTVKKLTSVEE